MDFIPAKESKLVIWFFDWYTRFLVKRRFANIYTHQDYFPNKDSKTVYYMNHNYWWDGLLPLYLNRKFFKQKARALMEDKQMKQYPFFSKIGAFSINLENAKSSIKSLRYAVESMNRENACLFIYPEGKLNPFSNSKPEFKDGLSWLYQKMEDVDYVPIAFYIDYSKSNKPNLYISVGKSVDAPNSLTRNELKSLFQDKLEAQMNKIESLIFNSNNS